jgi:deoxyribonuclease-4
MATNQRRTDIVAGPERIITAVPRLGAHLSAAGGVSRAIDAAGRLRCRSLQVFLRAPGRWAAAPLADAEVERVHSSPARAAVAGATLAHAPYLLNLASGDQRLAQRSVAVLVEELERAALLGIDAVVLHPGSAGTGSREDAEARCRAAITEAVATAGSRGARLLLEGQAGAGGQLGRTPAELARLVEPAARERVGICLDTAHLWAAGYELATGGLRRVLDEVGEHWGGAAPDALHINDTNVALGSGRDRHAPPGEGVLGEPFYRKLLAHEALAEVPMILEIPPGKNDVLVRRALNRLRRWGPTSSRGSASPPLPAGPS